MELLCKQVENESETWRGWDISKRKLRCGECWRRRNGRTARHCQRLRCFGKQ